MVDPSAMTLVPKRRHYVGEIGIFVSCRNLITTDLLTTSDPAVAVLEKSPFTNHWVHYSQTETLWNTHHPNFTKQFLFKFDTSGQEREIRFRVYDVERGELRQHMGELDVKLFDLVFGVLDKQASNRKALREVESRLQDARDGDTEIDVDAEEEEKARIELEMKTPYRAQGQLVNPEKADLDKRLRKSGASIILECRLYRTRRPGYDLVSPTPSTSSVSPSASVAASAPPGPAVAPATATA